jgi:hypothetical protein
MGAVVESKPVSPFPAGETSFQKSSWFDRFCIIASGTRRTRGVTVDVHSRVTEPFPPAEFSFGRSGQFPKILFC